MVAPRVVRTTGMLWRALCWHHMLVLLCQAAHEQAPAQAHAQRRSSFAGHVPVVTSCTNDSSCIARGGAAWQCVEATAGVVAASLGGAAPPCRINGRQKQRPDGSWAWAAAACVCADHTCHPGPHPTPSPPPAGLGYGCAAGRCMQAEHGAMFNSTGSCEWSTGCVGLHRDEWVAAAFEWKHTTHSNRSVITCDHANSFLKKSQLQSGALPSSQKLAVAQGVVVALEAPPKPIPGTSYWLITCAQGSVCDGSVVGAAAAVGVYTTPTTGTTAAATTQQSGGGGGTKESSSAAAATAAAAAALPYYLMIGDSISLGYLSGVQSQLAGKFQVVHSAGNAGNMNKISHDLACFLSQIPSGERASVVTFNAGIHDLARGQEWLSLQDYSALMQSVSARLAVAADRVVFVATTPVPTNMSSPSTAACPEGILDTDVRRYNAAATAIAQRHNISVLDLHEVVVAACGGTLGYSSCPGIQEPENPHFLDKGWALLATAVAKAVVSLVAA